VNTPAPDQRSWTTDEVEDAAQAAVTLVTTADGLDLGEYGTDLLGLAAHATMALLRDPAVSLDQVMDACYAEGAAQVRTWWNGWA
jgi:hypothetical protein